MLSQVGELASSKSAMKPLAPEFSALMTILRSVGPVISTRRSAGRTERAAHLPVALADLPRLVEEVERAALGDRALTLRRLRSSALALVVERAVQVGDQGECVRRSGRARSVRKGPAG